MTEPRQGKAKPRGVRRSPVELAKVVAMEIAGNPARQSGRIPRVRLAPIARIILAGVVILGLLIPAIEGAGWVESTFGDGTAISREPSTTIDDEVLSVLVREPEVDERIGSSPLIDELAGSHLLGPGAPAVAAGQTPLTPTSDSLVSSTVTSSTSLASTSTSVVPSTTVSTEAASTTTSTTTATTSTTVPTTTTTCRGNSGGNGKGNNC